MRGNMTCNKSPDESTDIDAQRRQVVAGSLAILGTASTGLLAGCAGGSSNDRHHHVTPLELLWISPSNDATNASVDTRVTLVFSEPVTVGSSAITMTGPSGAVATTLAVSGANVTLIPLNPLSPGQKYTLTITSGVKSAGGNAYGGSTASFTATAQAVSLGAGAMVCDSYYPYRWSDPPRRPWGVLPHLRRDGFRWLRMWVTTLSAPELRTTDDWSALGWRDEYWSCLEVSGAILAEAAALGFRLQAVLFLTDQAAHAGQQPLAAAWAGLTP